MPRPAELTGHGLFTGRPALLRIQPAVAGCGITFRRTDVKDAPLIPARIEALAPHPTGMPARSTNLAAPGMPHAGIMTVEHLLSALAGMGSADCLVEIDGPEVPIGDGSASPFVEAIRRAGINRDAPPPAPLTLDREIIVEAGDARIVARPRSRPGFCFTYQLDYGAGPILPQSATFEGDNTPAAADTYAAQIAPARTFCLEREAQAMRAMGLFTNLMPRDMLVFGERGPIDNELRFDNEPARHKLLDLIGDLALAGRPLQIDVVATRSGHSLNHALARELAQHRAG
jgi:UDP-3-O-acyl N-acetylglucosamine deacetylase